MLVTMTAQMGRIVFCGAAAHLGSWRLMFEVSRAHTITHTHTPGRTLLNELSAFRRDRYLHNTQQTQETNIHASDGTRNRDSSNQAFADLGFRPHGHRVRRMNISIYIYTYTYTHTHVYIYTHTYRHTHTHKHTCLRARECLFACISLLFSWDLVSRHVLS
jgi:hypothetical protein